MDDAGKTLWCVGCGEGFTSAMPSGTRCLDCEKAPAAVDWRARCLAAEAALRAIIADVDAVLAEAERPRGGMSVPYQGLFASVLHFPSVRRDLNVIKRTAVFALEASRVR